MKPILLDIPEKLETKRLIISIYDTGDGEEFFQLIQSNYDHLREELSEIQTLKTIENAEEYIRYKKVAWISRERMVPKIIEKTTRRNNRQPWIKPKMKRIGF